MGKRGPKGKPTNLRILHGDRPDRINQNEPPAPQGAPEPPYEMEGDVREVWDYTVRSLVGMTIASPVDRDALAVYCEAVALHRRASAMLAGMGANGILVRTQRSRANGAGPGFMRNPLLQVQRDAAATIRAYAQEFGLTPAARSEITAGGATGHGLGAERLLNG
jgi:P27 family predicted phage terminase small subunit